MSKNKKDTVHGVYVASAMNFTEKDLSSIQKEIDFLQKEAEKIYEHDSPFETELEIICTELANIKDSITTICQVAEKIS